MKTKEIINNQSESACFDKCKIYSESFALKSLIPTGPCMLTDKKTYGVNSWSFSYRAETSTVYLQGHWFLYQKIIIFVFIIPFQNNFFVNLYIFLDTAKCMNYYLIFDNHCHWIV